MRPFPLVPASEAQRTKVRGRDCLICGRKPVDPAHIVPRKHGGCDHPDCVIPLCRPCHRAYDTRRVGAPERSANESDFGPCVRVGPGTVGRQCRNSESLGEGEARAVGEREPLGSGRDAHVEEKGYLRKTPSDERAFLYRPAKPRQQVVGAMVRDFVDRVFDGAPTSLLLHLAKDNALTPKQRRVIEKLIEDIEE
jgi:hypothetical protein